MATYMGTYGWDSSHTGTNPPPLRDPADPTANSVDATGNDTLYGFEYYDVLQGYRGSDTLYGGTEDDVLWGDTRWSPLVQATDGSDFLYGEAGNDQLHGNAGDDVLEGGPGDDHLYGGAGFDMAVFSGAPDYYYVSLVGTHVRIEDGRRLYGVDLVRDDVEYFRFGNTILSRAEVLVPPSDDYAGDTTTAGHVTVSGTSGGVIQSIDDWDWFRVQLDAGAIYRIDLMGAVGTGALPDPYLGLHTSAGELIAEDNDSGVGLNSQLSFTPDATGTYFISARNYGFDIGIYLITVTVEAPAFPGGIDDVLWRRSDGRVATADTALYNADGSQIADTGDFDGDGDSDILWHHRDTGGVRIVEIESGRTADSYSLPGATGSWEIQETGDFDDDGDDDILWHHDDTGQVVLWEVEDGAYVRTRSLPAASGSWEVQGAGDFDRDGDADILWRHGNTGQVVVWEMENGAHVRTRNVATQAGSWEIEGVGDFDRDGDADILWLHPHANTVVIWQMESGALARARSVASTGGSWEVQGVHDFDSDGDPDVLWRHETTGQVLTWTMENAAFVRTNNLGVVSQAWQIRGIGDFEIA